MLCHAEENVGTRNDDSRATFTGRTTQSLEESGLCWHERLQLHSHRHNGRSGGGTYERALVSSRASLAAAWKPALSTLLRIPRAGIVEYLSKSSIKFDAY